MFTECIYKTQDLMQMLLKEQCSHLMEDEDWLQSPILKLRSLEYKQNAVWNLQAVKMELLLYWHCLCVQNNLRVSEI